MNTFEKLINELLAQNTVEEQLKNCIYPRGKNISNVPLRYRIIALGFVCKLNLNEVNQRLQQNGLSKLYSRNFWDSTLIYAFEKGLKYEEWNSLKQEALKFYHDLSDPILNESSISLNDIKKYLDIHSDNQSTTLVTKHLTQHMESQIRQITSTAEFLSYIQANINNFSIIREKTRYYYLKYLYYYLNGILDDIIISQDPKEQINDLSSRLDFLIIKGITKLDRCRTLSSDQKKAILMNSSISPKALFNEFNFYYFSYITKDWTEILLDDFEFYKILDIDFNNPKTDIALSRLANAIRAKNQKDTKRNNIDWASLSNKEIFKEEINYIDNHEDESRDGEKQIRNIIQGKIDLNRTALISFLMFFSTDPKGTPRKGIPNDQIVDEHRMNEILVECGYQKLDSADLFDHFIIQYLKTKKPELLLQELAFDFAENESDTPLFQLYIGLKSENIKSEKIYGGK